MWGVQTGTGCDCLADSDVQAGLGFGLSSQEIPALIPGVLLLLMSKDKRTWEFSLIFKMAFIYPEDSSVQNSGGSELPIRASASQWLFSSSLPSLAPMSTQCQQTSPKHTHILSVLAREGTGSRSCWKGVGMMPGSSLSVSAHSPLLSPGWVKSLVGGCSPMGNPSDHCSRTSLWGLAQAIPCLSWAGSCSSLDP